MAGRGVVWQGTGRKPGRAWLDMVWFGWLRRSLAGWDKAKWKPLEEIPGVFFFNPVSMSATSDALIASAWVCMAR